MQDLGNYCYPNVDHMLKNESIIKLWVKMVAGLFFVGAKVSPQTTFEKSSFSLEKRQIALTDKILWQGSYTKSKWDQELRAWDSVKWLKFSWSKEKNAKKKDPQNRSRNWCTVQFLLLSPAGFRKNDEEKLG